MRLFNPHGRMTSSLPTEGIHPAREQGRNAGRNNAGNWEMFEQVVEIGLGCAMDRKALDEHRRKAAENVLGFAEGWGEIMAITPLLRLTRQETARVYALPDPVRRRWMAEYEAAKLIIGGKLPPIPGG